LLDSHSTIWRRSCVRAAAITEDEFLDWAANFIGGTADEIGALLTKWRG